MSIRVRFAPSPTGYLHVGGARTALFNWLFARQKEGSFILRIEDTDEQRSDPAMVSVILEGLRLLGIDWDEGPFFQSGRKEIYAETCSALLERGLAYYDFSDLGAGPEEYLVYRERSLEEARERIAEGASPAVRFKVPREGQVRFRDLVFGDIEVQCSEVDDFVIARSGGVPTYHLSVVADDIDMGISHVIRSADHLSNTPKHVLLFQSLDYRVPIFAHLPLILGTDKKRLSKRHGATSVSAYVEQGILPAALRNYLALLGWSPGGDREMLSREELIELFDLQRINRANAVFDPVKLEWMNKQYLSELPLDELRPAAREVLEKAGLFRPEYAGDEEPYFLSVLNLIRSRINSLNDLAEYGKPYFSDDFDYEEAAIVKYLGAPGAGTPGALAEALREFRDACADTGKVFTLDSTEKTLRGLAARFQLKAGDLIGMVRLGVTGRSRAPGIFEVLSALGRERTVARLDRLLDMVRNDG